MKALSLFLKDLRTKSLFKSCVRSYFYNLSSQTNKTLFGSNIKSFSNVLKIYIRCCSTGYTKHKTIPKLANKLIIPDADSIQYSFLWSKSLIFDDTVRVWQLDLLSYIYESFSARVSDLTHPELPKFIALSYNIYALVV